jgi:steroid 5-alpha reductase family enzyme
MSDSEPTTKRRGGLIVTVVYLLALAAAWWSLRLWPGLHPLVAVAVADTVATIVVFAGSVATNNSSMYDPYWSVAPPVIAAYLVALPEADQGVPTRQGLVLGLVLLWAIRLTHNWWRGWPGLHHEDWRYVDFRRSTGRLYWVVSFLGIHYFPTVMVYLGCLALWPALVAGGQPLGLLDGLAALVTVVGIGCEYFADNQLRAFTQRKDRDPSAIMAEGLWAYSRHPNYFGEITFWWGLFLFGVAATPSGWWPAILGPLTMLALFLGISIPLMEKRMKRRRPAYGDHQRRVSVLVPWPPRRG